MTNSWIVNNYLEYIEESFPKYFVGLTEDRLNVIKGLYFSVNDFFVLFSCFDKEEFQNKNFFNLVKEFKSYKSRLLLVIPINDKYLVDSLLRLLIEKLYRIIYAHNYVHLLESSIRKHDRRKMSARLEGKASKKNELDDMYNEYSKLIHHSNPTTTDLLDFKQLSETNTGLEIYINSKVEVLKEIFLLDFFIPKIKESGLDLASKMRLKYQLTNSISNTLEALNLI